MQVEEVRALSDEEIAAEIEKHHEEWRNLRFQDALGRLTTVHQFRVVRKSIARLKTIQREREIALDPVGYYAANDRKRARRRLADKQGRISKRKHQEKQSRKRR